MKRKLVLGIAALMAVGVTAAIGKTSAYDREARDARIIVQLDSPFENKSEQRILNEQRAVISNIRNEVTYNYKVSSHFSHVLNAFTMEVNSKHVSKIRNLPGIKKVVYDTYREVSSSESDLQRREAVKVETAIDNISKETMNIPDGTKEGEGTLIAILDSSFMVHATSPEKDPLIKDLNDATHATYTALDDDVSVKYTQAGIKAVIDAAGSSFHGKYDATHSTYLNNKVPFYYDYGGDVELASTDEDRHPGPCDYDVYTEGSDHGNHVASIAAGNDPLYKGIAPKAQLALMKVFTATTYYQETQDEDGNTTKQKVISVGAYDECILKAFEDCSILKVDVINMSLGSPINELKGTDSLAFEAIKNLERQGVEFSISAGNEGKDTFYNSAYEYWTTDMVETGILGSYATADEGMIIAAGEPGKQYFDTALIVNDKVVAFSDQVTNRSSDDYDPERFFTDLLNLPGHSDGQFDWIKIPGLGSSADFDSLKEEEDDEPVNGKIAVIDRGDLTFATKIQNAIRNKAIACAIIDNDPSATDFTFRMSIGYTPSIPVVAFLYKDRSIFGEGGDSGTCKLLTDEIQNNPKAYQIASYSSDGPTGDLRLKADITTPGSNILGAVYSEGEHGYDYYSGTSMAAPNFAGVYALMLAEHLDNPNWKASINDRLMSSAVPSKDNLNAELASPRRQGAGYINVGKALETNVYLDGSADANNLSKKAKVELLNNSSIKNGNVKFDYSIVSEETSAVSYNTTLYVYRPKTVKNVLEVENYDEKLYNATLATINDTLIAKVNGTLNVQPGNNSGSVNYQIADSVLRELDGLFEFGCYIEGFLVLEAQGKPTLSLPYLGFYGDYDSAIPVEPFKFERDNNKVYPSDLLNSIGTKWAGKPGCDYGSDWVSGNWDDLKDLSVDNYAYNDLKMRDMIDGNKETVVPVGTNPYTGETETTEIYMGNNGFSNTMLIAQYVMRTVSDNTITITNKANNKVVLTDHMFDMLYGAIEDDEGNDIQWPLFKSHLNIDWYSNGLLATRAYTIIPLYEYEYDEDNEEYIVGDNFPDGEYEVKFSYDIYGGGTYEKKYTLHIDSEIPQIKSVEDIEKDGEKYIRFRFDELKLSYVSINAYKYEVNQDDQGYYYDIKASDYASKNKVYIKSTDYANAVNGSLTHVNDANHITLSRTDFTNGHDFKQTFQEIDKHSFSVSFDYTKSNKKVTLTGDVDVAINISGYKYQGAEIKVYTQDASGTKTEIPFVQNGDTIVFSGNAYATFVVDCDVNDIDDGSDVPPEGSSSSAPVDSSDTSTPGSSDADKPAKKGCGGSIIASSAILGLTAMIGLTVVLSKKKNEK